MHFTNLAIRVSVVVVLSVAGGGLATAVAQAEPSGCNHTTVATYWGTPSAQHIVGDGDGHCSTSATRNMRAEIKRDVTGLPDPLVAANEAATYGTHHHVRVETCDGGKVAVYYARSWFTSSPTYSDSQHYTFHTCK